MLLPKVSESTVENVTTEFFRNDPFKYVACKIEQLKEHDPNLAGVVADLCSQIFVENDDSDEETKMVNLGRAAAVCMVVINVINTQMEIDWLRA